MSLEERLDALTNALNRNSDLLEGLTAKAKAGVEASAKATKKSEKADDDGDDEKPARGRKAKADKPAKAPTVAEMKKEAEAFLDVEDEDEYNERRAIVRAIADYFEAQKFTEIESKDRAAALHVLKMAAGGENVDPDDIASIVEEMDGGGEAAPAKKSRRSDDV